jgi:hypothetical protein
VSVGSAVSLSCRDSLLQRQQSKASVVREDDVITGETSFDPTHATDLRNLMAKSKRKKWHKLLKWKKPKVGSPVLVPGEGVPEAYGGKEARKRGGGTGGVSVGTRGLGGARPSVDANTTLASPQPGLENIVNINMDNSEASSSMHSSTIFDTTDTYPHTRSASDTSIESGVAEGREGEQGKGKGKEKGREGEEGAREGEWILLEVSVADTGIGIDPAIVPKLFRPYAQAAVSTMREYPFLNVKNDFFLFSKSKTRNQL